MIEIYSHKKEGYNPYLIGPKWQVAHLNFLPELAPDAIDKVEKHSSTDETFLLMAGKALLIAAAFGPEYDIQFELIRLQAKVLYNVPKNCWHNIAMSEDAEISITENANTHLNDVEYFFLSEKQRNELKNLIQEHWDI